MPSIITDQDIQTVVQAARLSGYTGQYFELGGGEINDTFLLDCDSRKVVLRVARYEEQQSLATEAATLKQLDLPGSAPQLVFFDQTQRLKNKLWIMESYIEGSHAERLSVAQFRNLGALLARVHASTAKHVELDIWAAFLERRKLQYDTEAAMLNHPDERLRILSRRARKYVQDFQGGHAKLSTSIIHGDATPTNILVNADKVALIDWEFAHRNDPMAEFSTIYYEDMDYNDGKWRIRITDLERNALFDGYRAEGASIDEDRIQLWMNIDKLGASLYLYWRLNMSGRDTAPEQAKLYRRELEKLIDSLQKYLPQ